MDVLGGGDMIGNISVVTVGNESSSSIKNTTSAHNGTTDVRASAGSPEWSEYHVVTLYTLVLTLYLGVPGVLTNVWVIVTVLRCRMISARAGSGGTYLFVVSLALTDICSMISRPGMITVALLLGDSYQDSWVTGLTNVGTLWMVFTLQYHILMLAASRYCSIRYWRHYQRWFTLRTSAALVAACWLLGLLVVTPLITGHIQYGLMLRHYTYIYAARTHPPSRKFATFSLGTFVITLLVVIYCYSAVVWGIRKRSKQLGRSKQTGVVPAGVSSSGIQPAHSGTDVATAASQQTAQTTFISSGGSSSNIMVPVSVDGASNSSAGSDTRPSGPASVAVRARPTSPLAAANNAQPATKVQTQQVGVKKHEMTLARQFAIITFIYMLTIIFFFLTVGLNAAGIRSTVITMANNTFFAINFACHPVIYLIFNRTLRRNMITTLTTLGGPTRGCCTTRP